MEPEIRICVRIETQRIDPVDSIAPVGFSVLGAGHDSQVSAVVDNGPCTRWGPAGGIFRESCAAKDSRSRISRRDLFCLAPRYSKI